MATAHAGRSTDAIEARRPKALGLKERRGRFEDRRPPPRPLGRLPLCHADTLITVRESDQRIR